ncbi:MAG: pyridoxal phosphate-dependent aminotransferase [Limisphaerales bacterium]
MKKLLHWLPRIQWIPHVMIRESPLPPSALRIPHSLVRPLVRRLRAYVPGEQPKVPGLVKLNTNENPFPPSPRVLAAIKAATDERLRRYPNPTADALREKVAKFHRCRPENIIAGNGSDELLALATRAFVEPHPRVLASRDDAAPDSQSRNAAAAPAAVLRASASTVQFFTPSYSLYPVLAEIQGGLANAVPLRPDFGLPSVAALQRGGRWDFRAALTCVTTPNAPSGRGYPTRELETLCRTHRGVLVLDEAYVDFADENAMRLALRYPHVLVARTFSKAYSLCFLRVGYFVGHADLIAALLKIRDSYNVNGLGQAAASATLGDLAWYRNNFRRILATRARLSRELAGLGFEVFPSRTNFVLARPPGFPARGWLEQLRARKILVRWFDLPKVNDCLRITIGTDAEIDALLNAVRSILKSSASIRKPRRHAGTGGRLGMPAD